MNDSRMPEYQTKLGHTHIKVRDLERALDFYTRFFSMHLVEQVDDAYAFLTGSEVHHELSLKNEGAGAPTPPENATGLYHVAFEVPNKAAFARAYQALTGAGTRVATVDHHISWAMYFDDPDGNGLEIYCDTRSDPNGAVLWRGENLPLTRQQILAALESRRLLESPPA